MLKTKHSFYYILVMSILVIRTAYSATPLEDIYRSYKAGSYQKTVNLLNALKPKAYPLATTEYWLGLSHARLQDFATAIPHFKQAIKVGGPQADIHYELGQALYAMNELASAVSSFKKSIQKKYKTTASLYYVAHISQILEKHSDAKKYYTKLYKYKGVDKRMKQVALFQLGEVFVALAAKKNQQRKLIKKYVLPLLDKAVTIDPSSIVSKDIRKRKKELMAHHQLDPYLMRNGEQLSKKNYHLLLTETIKYDTNSTLSTDDPSKQATKEQTTIFETMANADYRFLLFKRIALTPSLLLTHSYYGNRQSADVYTNDSYSITSTVRSKLFHHLFKRQANFLLDASYTYSARDWTATKKVEYYDRATTITIGEKIKYFSWGDSSLKFKLKMATGHQSSIDKSSYALSLTQVVIMPWGHLGVGIVSIDDLQYTNDSNSDNRTYLSRFDYIGPNLWGSKYSINGSLTAIWLDTKEQKASRGVEFSYTPGVKLSYQVKKSVGLSLSYEYTSNSSKQSDYTYTKYVTAVELSANF
ncbi:MAG: tetratricopeptide repeat protein [Bdellovibrionales bacterium]|jgi:tetratricopeptide (TPR) repeat protein|nr:tetratricopeptide repeat protein [Bdellovibrionales bacterium]MBT3525280.1 tetratricopeptide repeat protein [Bdellovibrionales bacterium]MBT7668586.1 tetratricopeptide repeat protein [Bdellovibrionales bacterium]MBT7767429.1 tetratricopeptide repeat protein [Bdellovibrionales bacterium]